MQVHQAEMEPAGVTFIVRGEVLCEKVGFAMCGVVCQRKRLVKALLSDAIYYLGDLLSVFYYLEKERSDVGGSRRELHHAFVGDAE